MVPRKERNNYRVVGSGIPSVRETICVLSYNFRFVIQLDNLGRMERDSVSQEQAKANPRHLNPPVQSSDGGHDSTNLAPALQALEHGSITPNLSSTAPVAVPLDYYGKLTLHAVVCGSFMMPLSGHCILTANHV